MMAHQYLCMVVMQSLGNFNFHEDARWNAERQAVEFGVEIGERHHGVVRVPRRVFQCLLPEPPTPERCVEAYYLQRTRFESIAVLKLRPAAVDRGLERGDQRVRLARGRRLGPRVIGWRRSHITGDNVIQFTQGYAKTLQHQNW
jgi:hypothetical protein